MKNASCLLTGSVVFILTALVPFFFLAPPTNNEQPTTAPCIWNWATQVNQPLTDDLQSQFAPNDMIISVYAEEFGENCLNPDGSVRYFAQMQTDFRITAQVTGDDTDAIKGAAGQVVGAILPVLANYPPDATPGPHAGDIFFELIAITPTETFTYRIQVDYEKAIAALDQGLSGEALIDALGGLEG